MAELAADPSADGRSAGPAQCWIGYVSIYDATDISKWRRAGHFMARSLEQAGAMLSYVGPLELSHRWLTKPKAAFYNRLANHTPYRSYYPGRDRRVVRALSAEVDRRLGGLNIDAIVSGESPFSQPVAYLKTELPVVVWTDVTLAGVIGFYPSYSHLCAETIRDGMANERAALRRADLVVLSSPWAAAKAIDTYGLDSGKVKIANNGPGPMLEVTDDEVRRMIDARDRERCRLLFVGENWERKGGETALRVIEALSQSGVRSQLDILGCSPPPGRRLPPEVRIVGWVDKSTEAGRVAFRDLIGQAHFLLLPTLADCTPMVVCEASAHGVPVLATDVGGLPWMVSEGQNGRTFPLEADPIVWRDAIVELFGGERYRSLAINARAEYHQRLNWDTQGRKVLSWLGEVLAVA